MNKLYQPIIKLEQTKIDIIGDVHGEYEHLLKLLNYLGYDENFNHNDNRIAIFVGDLIDRGPKSVSVAKMILNGIKQKKCFSVAGNHEINILQNDAKPGACWFFDDDFIQDKIYLPREKINYFDKNFIIEEFKKLPLIIETPIVNIVHAHYDFDTILNLQEFIFNNNIIDLEHCSKETQKFALNTALKEHHLSLDEFKRIKKSLYLQKTPLSKNEAKNFAWCELKTQNLDFVSVISSGKESILSEEGVYFAHRFRFTQRDCWWRNYNGKKIIFGHYWRQKEKSVKNHENIWEDFENGFSWLGNKNAYCIDYSVGRNYYRRFNNLIENNLYAISVDKNIVTSSNGECFYI